MQLSFHLHLAVVVMTALAGTGCAASLILLWFSLGGNMQFVTMSAIYVTVTAVITFIGLFILRIAKNKPADSDQRQQE
jgi:hypothetical protein